MNKRHVKLLKLALKDVQEFNQYTCISIRCHIGTFESLKYDDAGEELCDWIDKLLEGESSLNSWLYGKRHTPNCVGNWHPQMHATRIAWINWMIEVWSQP